MADPHQRLDRAMPWQRRSGPDGQDEPSAAPDGISDAQLASLRALEAEVSRSIRFDEEEGGATGEAPRHDEQDHFVRLAEDLMAELAQERMHRSEFDRRLAREAAAAAVERRRALDAGECAAGLARLLRDVERQLTTLRVHTDRLVDAVDRAAFAA